MRRLRGERTVVDYPGGDPITVRSRLESRVANDLNARGVEWEYESISLKYTLVHTYTPDIVLTGDKGQILVEVKGYFMPQDRTKLLHVREVHPEIDLRLLFQSAERTLNSKSKTTYAAWCQKNNFKYCENRIPDSWLKELSILH